MSVTIRTCLVVTCTRCGQVDPDEGIETLHADTLDQLRDWLTDWEWSTPDTPEYCPDCKAEFECERNGHQWNDWHPSHFPGHEHIQCRSCTHCRRVAVRDLTSANA